MSFLPSSPLLRYLRAELSAPYTTLELACIAAIFYGAHTTRFLAHDLNLTFESIDRTMKRLAKRKTITRRPCLDDEFSHTYTLTPDTKTFLLNFLASLKKPTQN